MRRLLAIVSLAAACGLDVPPNVDRDNDRTSDSDDNCPELANPDQSDFDGDGIGDACDTCDASSTVDADADGVPDECDGCVAIGVDVDEDGIDDACDDDTCVPGGTDGDHDGIDDNCDPLICEETGADLDHDGVDDGCDPCLQGPQHDEDGDGLYDGCDNCPADPNPDQADTIEPTSVRDAGDACDASPVINQAYFDPFTTMDGSEFVQGTGIQIGPEQLSMRGPARAWVMQPKAVMSAPFGIRTHVSSVVSTAALTEFGLVVASDVTQPSALRATCKIHASSTGFSTTLQLEWTTKISGGSTQTAVPSALAYDLALRVGADGSVECTANKTMLGAQIGISGTLVGGVMSATKNTTFDWYFALY